MPLRRSLFGRAHHLDMQHAAHVGGGNRALLSVYVLRTYSENSHNAIRRGRSLIKSSTALLTSSGGKRGRPKNNFNHLPISDFGSLYSLFSPNAWILRNNACPQWKRQPLIRQFGNTSRTAERAACLKSRTTNLGQISFWAIRFMNSHIYLKRAFSTCWRGLLLIHVLLA